MGGINKGWPPPFKQLASLFQMPFYADKRAFQKEVTPKWKHIPAQDIVSQEQQKMASNILGVLQVQDSDMSSNSIPSRTTILTPSKS